MQPTRQYYESLQHPIDMGCARYQLRAELQVFWVFETRLSLLAYGESLCCLAVALLDLARPDLAVYV